MTPTPVGMRCPGCARERTRVRTPRTVGIGRSGEPTVTYALIAINVVVWVATLATGERVLGGGASALLDRGALSAPAIAGGHEYWRLLTSGFFHFSVFHILFNMYFLYIMGRMLEPAYGPARFLALYVTCLLAGSLGALLLTPHAISAGASGALFGLLGAAIVSARARGIPIWQSGLGVILVINIAFSLYARGSISLGAHLGGLLAGLAVGALVEYGMRGRRAGTLAVPLAGCAAISAAVVAGSLVVAHGVVG